LLGNWTFQQEGEVMKIAFGLKALAGGVILGGAALCSGGCQSHSGLEYDFLAPPAYSSGENFQRQLRYAAYDWSQAIEDFDKQVVMTRPGSHLTGWNIVHGD
jgi:hypothetical protein